MNGYNVETKNAYGEWTNQYFDSADEVNAYLSGLDTGTQAIEINGEAIEDGFEWYEQEIARLVR